ncbi:hypothetical protein CCACVL1_28618 [Corchorus capsularis]|uniref:KIN17-like protein n=1 Tax=Corchorus capsularis TaxID=210143 RepID=A0A1R3G5W2_COCAP|nr:hypothetical protein CCACVL1_28618 [Corchorus capsularis]
MVLSNVPEAMQRRKRIQMPLHERMSPTSNANLRGKSGNPDQIVSGYSEEFEQKFHDLMKRSHRFSCVSATVVYNEFINDKDHVHMNSTQWATLTEFVKHLGRTGKCKVDQTEKGWFITYIDRDSETLFKEKMKNKRLKSDMVEEEKQEREIQKQIQIAEQLKAPLESEENEKKAVTKELNLESGVKIGFSLGGGNIRKEKKGESSSKTKTARLVFEEEENERKRKNEMKELMREEEKAKERSNRKDYWLCEGIIVKLMSKALAQKGYYKQKGVVRKAIDKYVGEIEMLESTHVLRVDQEELETVIPQIGGIVRIVNGAYCGSNARLLGVDTDKFCAKVQIEKGVYDGRVIQAIEYEDICKVAYFSKVSVSWTAADLIQQFPDDTLSETCSNSKIRESKITGTSLYSCDPCLLAVAEAERQFLEADYDEYAASNASGAAFCRSAALILMALLLLRHELTVPDSDGDDDVSTFFSEAAALAATQVAVVLQSGQCRGMQFTIASGPAMTIIFCPYSRLLVSPGSMVLHDAFFKYQAKLKLTTHGYFYHEGKESRVETMILIEVENLGKCLERKNRIVQTIKSVRPKKKKTNKSRILFALDGLDSTRIVHRDVKPQNIIFS